MASGFVAAGRVPDKCVEFYKGEILGVRIHKDDSDDTATAESLAGQSAGEYLGRRINPEGTDRTHADPGAMVQVQRAPPMMSSAMQSERAVRTIALARRKASARAKDLMRFMGLFVERIGGQNYGSHQVDDEGVFVFVGGAGNGNGRVGPKDLDAVGERIPVNVDVVALDETDGGVKVFATDEDGTGRTGD